MHFNYLRISILLLIAAAVAAAGIFSIADLDFWWHLKTGEIIVKTGEFQRTEIYSFTAFGREYIDHEWLFQVTQYFAYSLFGSPGVIFFKCAIIISIYLLTTLHLFESRASVPIVLAIQFLSLCGSLPRLIERPEIFTALFFVITYLLIHRFLKTASYKPLLFIPPLFAVWANFHAAVILGLVLQGTFITGLIIEIFLRSKGYPGAYNVGWRAIKILSTVLAASFLAALINPYGLRTLMVPFELTAIIDSGVLKNDEWMAPSPMMLPFFYACVLFTSAIFVANFRNLFPVQFIFVAFFGFISMKYIRNTGMFCWFMPLFVAPYVERLSRKENLSWIFAGASSLSLIYLLTYAFPFQRGLGISSYFPVHLSKFTKQQNLQGNLINSYGLGGYLIWSLYPERKIFIDGRNEVYLPFLEKLNQVRNDNRSWTRFLNDYQIEYALLNYVDRLEEVTVMDRKNQPTITYMPFTETHFPRSRWALIYWNDEGMIFVRRNGINRSLTEMEYKAVYPEGRDYHATLFKAAKIDRTLALNEVRRKLNEDPSCLRARRLLEAMNMELQ